MKERAFQKRKFVCSKSAVVTTASGFGKTVVMTLSLKEGCKKLYIFLYSDILHPVAYHAKKNKYEKLVTQKGLRPIIAPTVNI
jgi:hypothetical protein